jgi:uncharacterized protein YggE
MLLTVSLGSAAAAQAQTMLNLSATGETMVMPDQVAASLTAQTVSQNPVTAQKDVNAAMEAGLAMARAMPGMIATTANYNVSQTQGDNGNGPVEYTASEEMDLVVPAPSGAPSEAFGALLGKLQSRGFLLQNFDGGLSQAASRHAMQSAIADAMSQIQTQAKAVATALGESVERVTTVNLNYNMPGPMPMAPRMMAMVQAAPQAAPSNVTVQASVTASVVLTASK